MEFAEELNQDLIIQMVQMMGENGVGVSDPSFIRDLGLIIEMTKGSIYRSMGIPHPTHAFFETIVDVDIDEDDNIWNDKHEKIGTFDRDENTICLLYTSDAADE